MRKLMYNPDPMADSNLQSALSNNHPGPSAEIKRVLAVIEGERDGAHWHWIVELEDGTFAYLNGWCDYTGWDCHSGLDVFEEPTLEAVLRQVGEAERDELTLQAMSINQ